MIDNGNGTVTDETTGLMWQQETAQSLNWADSIRFCSVMTLGGYTDWRLPTVTELQTLVDRSEEPTINEKYFSDLWGSEDFYISCSVYPERGTKRSAWGVEFNGGKDFIGYMRYKHRFRACRDVYSAVQAKKEQLKLF